MEASSQRLDFPALLATLQGWLGCDLCVMVHRPNAEFNIGFCSRLGRVRSSQGTGDPAILDFEGARGLTLAPVEASARLHAVYSPNPKQKEPATSHHKDDHHQELGSWGLRAVRQS
jgi:hypothetical protein